MQKTFEFLKHKARVNGKPVNFLSTVADGLPSCRPFGDPVLFDGKIYALTMKHKSVSKQLAVLAEFDWAEEAGYTLDNPDFQLLYFADAKSECRDSDGELIWSEEF